MLLTYASPVLAVPVFGLEMPVIIDENQPEGPANLVNVKVWGDEFHRIMEDANGYALIRDSDTKVVCYAKLVLGVLQSTGTKVNTVTDPSAIGALKDLHLDIRGIFDAILDIRAKREAQVRKAPPVTTGLHKGLCILVDFSDKAGTITATQVDNFCNQKAASGTPYNEFGNNGSVYDFFYAVSDGKLEFTNAVYGYYHSPNARSYYDTSSKQKGGAQELIMEALKNLGSTIDISGVATEVGSDGKTYVKYLSVLYAGNMPADNTYPLWPHRWAISSADPVQDQAFVASDGKTYYADLYQMTNMGDALAIGTFCHESAHLVCGFSDYYDTKYSSAGLGSWCLMGAGNWNGNGYDPAPPQPYLRYRAGWITPKASSSSITSLTCNMSDVIIYPNPSIAQEYFLVSAIQKTGHFTSMPGEGLAVFHIDEREATNNKYQHDATDHYESALIQADGKYELESKEADGGNRGNATDLFSPANGGVTTFNDTSSPVNAKWWNGQDSGFSVTNIGAINGTSISVQLTSGGSPPTVTVKEASMSKGKFQLNFRTLRDNLDITLFSPDFMYTDKTTFETATNNTAVPVYIGTTLVDTVTPLYKGKGKGIGSLQWRYKQGYIRYQVRNTALQDLLGPYGATNDNVASGSVKLPFQIVVNGSNYGGEYTFGYKAALAKTGKGQVSY
ncbi:MAG: M6 family metalloprotease domain-containing protein [Planctomycetota bacterium]|nr:M6 family metalloprotease domain-containing protein [Planctomycetota bacterium]